MVALVAALVNAVLSLLSPVLTPVENLVPCVLDTVGIGNSFQNFTCDVNLTTADLGKVSQYVSCISSTLLLANFTANDLTALCPNVDLNNIGILLANCQWCQSSGCFQVGGKFVSNCNPISLAPQQTSCLDLSFGLYTSSNIYNHPQLINADLSNINSTNFNFNVNTTILIAGYFSGIATPIYSAVVPAILNCSNQNVIVLNWGRASTTLYEQAIANARAAGKVVANFIQALNEKYNYGPSKVHLIGHSLGCQLAGFAGAAYPIIGRITGLDPAGPSFDCDPTMRLDPTDAVFVDIIHTQAGEAGTVKNLGHVDFWPNGGMTQPGCHPKLTIQNLLSYFQKCDDHVQSIYYYASSMRFCQSAFNCSFQANMCSNYSDYQQGKCNSCGAEGSKCAQMGYFAQNYAWDRYPLPAPQLFYLQTTNATPFCVK